MTNYDDLQQLGEKTALPASPKEAVLEAVDNPHTDVDYNIRFSCPEFTSLCPLTGQPDFAKFVIDYIPDEKILESKSLKLFMHSFRNHGDFHEACTIYIGKRIVEEIKPKWLRIAGFWYPRGGIPIDIFWQTAEAPKGVLVPELEPETYWGR